MTTDEQLITALGWEPCRHSDADARFCLTHQDEAGSDGARCDTMQALLVGARAGIDLTRHGIAAELHDLAGQARGTSGVDGRTHHDSCWLSHVDCALLRAAAAASGWQP